MGGRALPRRFDLGGVGGVEKARVGDWWVIDVDPMNVCILENVKELHVIRSKRRMIASMTCMWGLGRNKN